jgi:predicted nucleotidyltransferase
MIIYQEILKEFQKQKVKYVIVGGIAVNLLGSLRSTADMDILVEMSDKNLAKVVRILIKHGYFVKQPVDPMGIADEDTRENWIHNRHMKAFNFYKKDELKEVDIIIDTPVSYQKARETIVRIKCGNMILPIISIDNLIKMKKKSWRNIDKLDIEELRKIKKFKRKIK